MGILHICTRSNYNVTKSFVRFINEEFNENKHEIIIFDIPQNVPEDIKMYDNVDVIKPSNPIGLLSIIYKMVKAEKIVLHSAYKTYFQLLLILNLWVFKKLFWVSWGADLYQWRSDKSGIKCKIRNYIAYIFRKRIKYFVGIFPPDIEFFKNEFKTDAETFHAGYVGGLYSPLYKQSFDFESLEYKKEHNKCINIQIGHSSTPILKHLDVLNELTKFRNKNIKIFIPLSYGDNEYADAVEKKAVELFGDKAVCMRQIFNKDAYMDFLSTIDIAIFCTTRQIGLGNITPLMYMGKKMFIPKESVMYEYFRSFGIDIQDYNRISNLDFIEFIHPVDMSAGKMYVNEITTNREFKVLAWNKVFNHELKERNSDGK